MWFFEPWFWFFVVMVVFGLCLVLLMVEPEQKQEAIVVRKEITYKNLSEMPRLDLILPKFLLKEWGFDPEKEITFWNDDIREVRVYVQKKVVKD